MSHTVISSECEKSGLANIVISSEGEKSYSEISELLCKIPPCGRNDMGRLFSLIASSLSFRAKARNLASLLIVISSEREKSCSEAKVAHCHFERMREILQRSQSATSKDSSLRSE